jgi:hypothetical protein
MLTSVFPFSSPFLPFSFTFSLFSFPLLIFSPSPRWHRPSSLPDPSSVHHGIREKKWLSLTYFLTLIE